MMSRTPWAAPGEAQADPGPAAPAAPGPLLRMARWWARRELRRSIDGLCVGGIQSARQAAAAAPTILASTHVAFWDAFVVLALDEALGTDGRALMDAENVCRVPLFARLGGIPLEASRPRAGLRLAAAHLGRPRRAIWIFPQGEHRPPHLRPLGFRLGVTLLARLAPAAFVIPVALQYAFGARPSPTAYACFGEPLIAAQATGREGLARLQAATERALERIDRRLGGEDAGFDFLVAPRRGWRRGRNR